MRLGGRLAAAIEIIDDIGRRHRPVAAALKDWGVSHRFAGAGDRGAIGNIVYDALRRRRSAGWLFDDETPRALGFGALILESGQTPSSLNGALDGDKFAPPPLDTREIELVETRRTAQAPDAVRADCPDWCAPLLQDMFGDDWVAEAQALAARPPLDLRANPLKASRDRIVAELSDAGAVGTVLAPHGVRIAPIEGFGRHPNVQAEPAFRKGWFEVQDEGSQIAAELAEAGSDMQVLDFCAGAGGKTLALSATMENRGQIFAYDSDKARLAPIFDRLRRAETRNVQVFSKQAELAPLEGHMDIVLVDAPCTGSGTWRRRPDAKWRLTQRQLDARIAEQAAILEDAKKYVRPGGRLVYVTCSLFAGENRRQIALFLADNSDFQPIEHRSLWDRCFPQMPSAARIDDGGGIVLSPARSGTDGFFFCALRRVTED